jgi:L-fucose isomerase-like protein
LNKFNLIITDARNTISVFMLEYLSVTPAWLLLWRGEYGEGKLDETAARLGHSLSISYSHLAQTTRISSSSDF